MNRLQLLDKAKEIVSGEREKQYGSPENNFETISIFWNNYLNSKDSNTVSITSLDVAMMMALLKVARVASGTVKQDSLVDIAGYAACAGELADEKVN